MQAIWEGRAGVEEVDYCGCGCLLIHRRVLEELDAPHFVGYRDKAQGGGEDVNFCVRAKRAGFTIKVDTRIETRHISTDGVGVAEALGHHLVKDGHVGGESS